ncbi:hypothetical protein BKA62DRAFT_774244 [Auriculariales sp. MPI-PUGE-AT-0066]|nr:hypothetical protein BKA62DRAFT_774244 [Auriculariales sp. MPI-PUGE-AT-0066]
MTASLCAISQAASVNLTQRDSFANFFDGDKHGVRVGNQDPHSVVDDNCQVNGGIGVSLDNPGCLAERGRGSVYIPNNGGGNTDLNTYCMVKTKDSDQCNCQNEGWEFTPTGFCAKLDSSFGSYRFIFGSCDQNNC